MKPMRAAICWWIAVVAAHGLRLPVKSEFEDAPSTVTFPSFYGRAGNNLHQVAHALFIAETTEAKAVVLPMPGESLSLLFDLPERIEVRADPEFRSRVQCWFQNPNLYWAHCDGVKRSDYVRVFRQYILPFFNKSGQEACQAEARNTRRELIIHLRSGDLLENSNHPQAKFAPCAFFEKVAHDFKFNHLRIITEPDMAHPCIKYLQRVHPDVIIQSKTYVEDACALMHARHLALGAMSSFSQSLNRFNAEPGMHYDPFGPCGDENTTELTCTMMRSIKYCVKGFDQTRTGQDKFDWMLHYGESDIHRAREVCDRDLLMDRIL
jgi:hypothetical protein